MPAAEERQLLSEHLFYEVQMTFFLAGELNKPTGSRVDLSLRNAQAEACAVHMRQLVEFFWCEERRAPGDQRAFAADYFPDDAWPRLRPDLPPLFERALRERPLARLAYDAGWVPPVDTVWDLVSQAFALVPVVRRFAETVDRAQLTAGYAHGMRMCAETFAGPQRAPADQAA